MRHELFLVRLFMFVVLVTQSRVAAGLLALAKGATPDSGGRERPISRSRLRRKLVLPHALLLLLLLLLLLVVVVLLLLVVVILNEMMRTAGIQMK